MVNGAENCSAHRVLPGIRSCFLAWYRSVRAVSRALGRFYWNRGEWRAPGLSFRNWNLIGIIMRDLDKLDDGCWAFGIPAVVLGHKRKEVPGLVNVVTDSPRIARMAAEHLLRCGFKNFGVLRDMAVRKATAPPGHSYVSNISPKAFAALVLILTPTS